MDWLKAIGEIWLVSMVWWAAFCGLFIALTMLFPCNPGRSWWTDPRAALTDLFYWLISPLLSQLGRFGFLMVGAWLIYGNNLNVDFTARHWPVWMQCLMILLLQDILMYGIHRLFHTRFIWKFHAVHHSSETLDWMSAVRFHPVNAIGEFALADAVILLMGFDPITLAILGPINLIYSVMVHANLNWTFGPLKYVFASPVFHRWHHTTEERGVDKNFAPTFPFIDYIFGSFYMPVGVKPEAYGVKSEPLPRGFVAQNVYPFRDAGQWAMKHPALATICTCAILAAGYWGYERMHGSIPVQEVAIVEQAPDEEAIRKRIVSLKNVRTATAIVANASGSSVIFGTADGSVIVRNVTTDEEKPCEPHLKRVNAIALDPSGTLAASASSDGTVRVFDPAKTKELRTLSHSGIDVRSVAVSRDGWIATGTIDGTLWLWNATGELVRKRTLGAGLILTVSLCDSGRHVVAAQNSQVFEWDTTADKLTECQGPKSLTYCVQIQPDGKQFAAGEFAGKIHLWQTGSEQPERTWLAHNDAIYTLQWNDGMLFSAGKDQAVRVWKEDVLLKEFKGHTGFVFATSFDKEHNRLLAAGRDLAYTGWKTDEKAIVPVGAVENR